MPGPAFLEDDTVALRVYEEEDIPTVTAWMNDPEVRRYYRGPEAFSVDSSEDHYEKHVVKGDNPPSFIVTPVDGDEPVGFVSISRIDHHEGTGWFAALVDPAHQGEGYATAATQLLCEYAFGELRVAKLRTAVFAPNEPSQRVLEKLGFRREAVEREAKFIDGERVDAIRFGQLRDEWYSE
ncbi:GNAT family N-acetyltransferase [Natronomonas sp. EA1]|uniref:GNAT family N-acetyltransferase n=1 Tax=Natronomonas sp. EA1 TaxID=3421655 RepID=UPI003EB824E9